MDLQAKEAYEGESAVDSSFDESGETQGQVESSSSPTHYSIRLDSGQVVRVPRNRRLAADAESSSVSTARMVPVPAIRKYSSGRISNHEPREMPGQVGQSRQAG